MTAVLKTALYSQVIWFILATGYNCLSLIAVTNGEQGFAGNLGSTSRAMVTVLIFGAVTSLGLLKRLPIYKWLSLLVAFALFIGGVLKHINLGPETYASFGHWVAAISINIFGATAYATGACASFRTP